MTDHSARLAGRTSRRAWLDVSAAYATTEGQKAAVATAIERLTWTDPPPDGPAIPVLPALAITTTARAFGLPALVAVAWNGLVGDHALYGLHTTHAAGDTRVYILDVGTAAIPLATDLWPPREADA